MRYDVAENIALLDFAKERQPSMTTKSGMMLGLGEEVDEVLEAAEALRDVGVDIVTVGQYLQPKGERTLPVERYVPPEEFDRLAADLRSLGFKSVACSPFVRSSYNAEEDFLLAGGTE